METITERRADDPSPPIASIFRGSSFQRGVNMILEEENSGYRFVGGQLTEITSPAEVREMEAALENAARASLDVVHIHIEQALQLLGKRPVPDFRNAIKEAMSAVESAAKLIGEKRKGALDDALDTLGSRMPIHPAMKEAFSSSPSRRSLTSGLRSGTACSPPRLPPRADSPETLPRRVRWRDGAWRSSRAPATGSGSATPSVSSLGLR